MFVRNFFFTAIFEVNFWEIPNNSRRSYWLGLLKPFGIYSYKTAYQVRNFYWIFCIFYDRNDKRTKYSRRIYSLFLSFSLSINLAIRFGQCSILDASSRFFFCSNFFSNNSWNRKKNILDVFTEYSPLNWIFSVFTFNWTKQ